MSDILNKYPGVRGRPGEMAMLCALLRDRGLFEDAFAIGEAAIAAAPNSLAIATEVRTVLSHGVQKFHRPMLLDDARNRIYADAIARMVRPGMKVLEIGCGAGLLAMLAARAGAEVVTCEGNPMIAAAATEIIGRNGLSDRIRVIPKMSTALQVPEDLAEPADLVIHEIFGAQLFDEGVTDSLADARRRLLKPGAPSIPSGASVRCALARGHGPSRRRTLANVEGFDLSAFDLLTSRQRWAADGAEGLHFCSNSVTALRMDYRGQPPFGPDEETVTVRSRGGMIEGVVQWIKIEFDDGNAHENDPAATDHLSSWGAPLSRMPVPFQTRRGDVLDLTLRHRGQLLTIDVVKRGD